MKIAVVDDDIEILEMIELFLQSLDHESILFSDPETAIDFLSGAEHNVDLVLTDYEMPKMNGPEMVKAIHKSRRLPFVVITGELFLPTGMYSEGLLAHLSKPGFSKKLEDILTVLDERIA